MTGPIADPGRTTPYRVLVLIVLLLALVTTAEHWASMQAHASDPTWRTLAHALKSELPRWAAWLVAIPPARWLIRRTSWRGWRIIPAALAHAALAAAVIVAHKAIVLAIHRLIGFPTGKLPYLTELGTRIWLGDIPGLVGYLAAVGAAVSIDYYTRFREREVAAAALGRELAEARLAALQHQLNPHFLFNALNSVSMLVRRGDGTRAVEMVARLSQFLRATLEADGRPEVPLAEEVVQLQRYLEVERARFGDRLAVSIDLPGALGRALVPVLVLQPLVENAIRHGVESRPDGGSVAITARRDAGTLVLEVVDDGTGPAAPGDGSGVGLSNTRARLAALYGSAAGLELAAALPRGTRATVRVPYRTAP